MGEALGQKGSLVMFMRVVYVHMKDVKKGKERNKEECTVVTTDTFLLLPFPPPQDVYVYVSPLNSTTRNVL